MKKITLVLVGCAMVAAIIFYSSSSVPSTDEPLPVLPGTSWTIASVSNKSSDVEESVLSLGFNVSFEKDRVVSGRICNSFSGKYMENGPSIKTSGISATKMYCNPEIMKYEGLFLDSLEKGLIYRKDGINLILTGVSGSPVFSLVSEITPQ
jgi:heat shock protein HslJ